MTRITLPQRRPNRTGEVRHNGQHLAITVGYDLTGRPCEVFANGPKEGSDMQHVLSDACVIISIALQNGIEPDALAHSLGTVPAIEDGAEVEAPASPLGLIIGFIRSEDAR